MEIKEGTFVKVLRSEYKTFPAGSFARIVRYDPSDSAYRIENVKGRNWFCADQVESLDSLPPGTMVKILGNEEGASRGGFSPGTIAEVRELYGYDVYRVMANERSMIHRTEDIIPLGSSTETTESWFIPEGITPKAILEKASDCLEAKAVFHQLLGELVISLEGFEDDDEIEWEDLGPLVEAHPKHETIITWLKKNDFLERESPKHDWSTLELRDRSDGFWVLRDTKSDKVLLWLSPDGTIERATHARGGAGHFDDRGRIITKD